jgi:hypothetical protein
MIAAFNNQKYITRIKEYFLREHELSFNKQTDDLYKTLHRNRFATSAKRPESKKTQKVV